MATDIAARGIDVSAITHVINYDMPDTADAYTHRIGRTGRVSRTGEAFTFVTNEDTSMAYNIECILGVAVEQKTLPGFDYKKPKADGPYQASRPQQQRQRGSRPAAQTPVERKRSAGDSYRIQISAR